MGMLSRTGRKPRAGVTERQAPGASAALVALACVPALFPALFLGYHYLRYKSLGGVDVILYPVLCAPVVLGFVVYASVRRSTKQLASVSEAVQLAAGGQAVPGELIVAEHGSGPARGWNVLVRAHLSGEESEASASRVTDENEEAIAVAMNALAQAVCCVDRAGTVLSVNAAAVSYFKKQRESLVGAPLGRLLTGDSLKAYEDVMHGRVQRRNGIDIVREGGQGDEIMRLTVSPTRESASVFAVVTIEDVTRQRMAEKSRHEFLAQATHELRTPLTNIRLYIEEAIDAENNQEAREEALNVISHESLRLERLVSELLDISELEAGARVMDKGDVRVEQLMEQLRGDYTAQAESKGIDLRFELPPKLPVLMGDRDKIAGALHNLLGNALKYTLQGGTVTVRVEESEGTLRFVFDDTGIGINPIDQQRIFEKFYRAQDERVSAIEGTGLGLAFAKQVAQMHGGDVALESQLNHGSTFTFSVPKPKLAA